MNAFMFAEGRGVSRLCTSSAHGRFQRPILLKDALMGSRELQRDALLASDFLVEVNQKSRHQRSPAASTAHKLHDCPYLSEHG